MILQQVFVAAALAALSTAAIAGREGTAGATANGSGGVITTQSLEEAVGATSPQAGVNLYARIRSLQATILLEDGLVVSPDTRLPNGRVVRFSVRPDGTIQSVEPVTPDEAAEAPAQACGA